MVSICLKSNSTSSLNLIENYLDNTSFPEIYYSQKKFKYFNNIIIHYRGKNIKKFYTTFSKIISEYVTYTYEKDFIMQQLNFDFFYFSDFEKKIIQDSVLKLLNFPQNKVEKNKLLHNCINNYFVENCTCNLDGFINFRLFEYKKFINTLLETSINDYILQKEYSEYIHLLNEYIQLQVPQSKLIHLIYTDSTKALLDESKNIIANTSNSNIYLSDISFSSNDFILNSLLTLLPEQLYIHLNSPEDNFIKFIKNIFNEKTIVCTNCDICSTFFSKK